MFRLKPAATVEYGCERCSAVLESVSSLAGRKDTCPRCGHKNTVPHPARRSALSWIVGGLLAVAAVALPVTLGSRDDSPGQEAIAAGDESLDLPPLRKDVKLAPVNISSLWGFKDPKGKIAIKARFDSAREFFDGLAAVKTQGKWGYIDHEGNLRIPPEFDWAWDFRDGYATVGLGRKTVTTEVIDYAELSKRLTEVRTVFSFRGTDGRMHVIPSESSSIPMRKEPHERPEQYGYIDSTGVFVRKPGPHAIETAGEGMARITINGKVGFIGPKGRIAVKPLYEEAGDFSEGLAAVRKGKKWGYVDKTGHVKIRCEFDHAESFQDGVARVGLGGPQVYIGTNGVRVSPRRSP